MERVMNSALADMEPKPVWKHFEALTKIPRASTKEAAARDYVLPRQEARSRGRPGHVATLCPQACASRPRNAPMALLQGHLDMVCEKNEGTAHNFDTDPIKVRARGRLAEGRRHHAGS